MSIDKITKRVIDVLVIVECVDQEMCIIVLAMMCINWRHIETLFLSLVYDT